MGLQRKWDLETAKACLARNGVTVSGGNITFKRAGIKVWGAIDYLVHVHKFSYIKEVRDV